MNIIRYPNNPQYGYQKPILNPLMDQSIKKQGIANSQIIQQGNYVPLSSQRKNLSIPTFSTSPSSRVPVPTIQQSIPQAIRQPIFGSPSHLNSQKVQYTQQEQPRYLQYNKPVQVEKSPQVNVVHEIEQVPIIHEIHHVNRPINVISIDEIEVPWRSKQILLEKQLIELQLILKRGPQKRIEIKEIILEDKTRIKELEQEIENLKHIVIENEHNIQNLEGLVDQAQYNLDNAEEQASDQIEKQNRELANQKKKFQDLNKKYHDLEEEITMTEAQIESIQKRKVFSQKSSTSKITSNSRVNQIRNSGSRDNSIKKNQ